MEEKYDPTSAATPTAAPQRETHPAEGTAHRATPGLGMFDRVNSLVGTEGIGVSSSVGGALESPTLVDSTPTIAGVDDTTHFKDEDDRYWRENHGNRQYANPASTYEDYQPAYRYGTEAAHRYKGRKWDEVEGDLKSGWDQGRGTSSQPWEHAKEAVRSAWHRMAHAFSGDADR